MAGMRPVLIPITQSGSGTSRAGGGGNIGRAARMNHGDIQQGGTMGRGKGHLNVSTRSLTARRGNTNGSVARLCTHIAARAGRDAAEGFLPVVVPTRATAAEAIAAHGMVDVAALDVTATKTSGGGDVRVGASCAKAEVAIGEAEIRGDEVAIGEAEIRGDRDGVQVGPRVPALETEQARVMRWGVAGLEEFRSRTLSQFLRKGGTRCPDLPSDSVSRHWDERRGRRQSKGLSRV
jgi:hypothetical protein